MTVKVARRPLYLGWLLAVASLAGTACGSATLDRHEVVVRHLAPEEVGFRGTLVIPPSDRAASPVAVIAIGGSQGGLTTTGLAQALAAEGIATLSLEYFNAPGLPSALRDIPLEYFARAARWLADQPDLDAQRIATWGISRGSEAALLAAAYFPDAVHDVVAVVPSNVVLCSPGCAGPAWTLHGAPLTYTRQFGPDPHGAPDAVIPVERAAGRLLLICGTDDRVWPSCPMADALARRARPDTAHVLRVDGGHRVGLLGQTDTTTPDEQQAWTRTVQFLRTGQLPE